MKAMVVAEDRQLRDRVIANIHRFEVPALLDALRALGYGERDIEYRSNPTDAHTAALIEDIDFQDNPRKVILTVNLGLMSNQGPLPAYFSELLKDQRDAALTQFLWFFDHRLLERRFAGLYPERDTTLFPDWADTKKRMLSLLRLRSPSGLHWLFQRVYPELEINIRRVIHEHYLRSNAIEMGSAVMGEGCAFGGFTTVPIGGIEAVLFCDEWENNVGIPWADAAQKRLDDQVLPLLSEMGLHLRVRLVFRDRSTYTRLQSANFLGYQPLYGYAPAPGQRTVQQVLLWQGEVGREMAVVTQT